MRNGILAALASAAILATPACAADPTATGGAIVGSPLDAPPQEVQTYVVQQPVEAVTIEAPVAVGKPLPRTVTLYPVQGNPAYVYAYVNGEPVVVDARTRAVVSVVQR